jgi:hypothetical protein
MAPGEIMASAPWRASFSFMVHKCLVNGNLDRNARSVMVLFLIAASTPWKRGRSCPAQRGGVDAGALQEAIAAKNQHSRWNADSILFYKHFHGAAVAFPH